MQYFALTEGSISENNYLSWDDPEVKPVLPPTRSGVPVPPPQGDQYASVFLKRNTYKVLYITVQSRHVHLIPGVHFVAPDGG